MREHSAAFISSLAAIAVIQLISSAALAESSENRSDAQTDRKQVESLLKSRTKEMKRQEIVVPPDSCDKIVAAFKRLTNGGTIRLLEGQYRCATPIILDRDNLALIGAGRSLTQIRANDGKAMPVIVIGDVINGDVHPNGIPYPNRTTKNVELGGLSIDGNYRSNPHAGKLECWNPLNQQSLSCDKDVGYFIRNNALTIRRSENVLIRNLDTSGAYSGGIVTEKYDRNLTIDDFTSERNFFDGFAGYETTASIFRNFSVHDNVFSGISTDAFFEGNTFECGSASDNGDNGIFSVDVGHNKYSHLVVHHNRNLGFYIDGFRVDQKEVPGTCDGIEISDSDIIGERGGILVNFGCHGTVLKRVKIQQAQMNCSHFNGNGTFSVEDSICTDGHSVRTIETQAVPASDARVPASR